MKCKKYAPYYKKILHPFVFEYQNKFYKLLSFNEYLAKEKLTILLLQSEYNYGKDYYKKPEYSKIYSSLVSIPDIYRRIPFIQCDLELNKIIT